MAAFLERTEGAVYQIFICRVLFRDFEADGMRLAVMRSVVRFFLRYGGARAIVICCKAEFMSVFC